ncbi:MAG: MerR family transcriptional regulator [Chloroflexi bacterium]|nr:MerR family transcriptional regulator [Chloroflexota bacterium]
MTEQKLAIGQVAQQTGLSVDTLRYYEDLGLLDPIERAPNGHRRYGPRDLTRIDFLKRLRATGMPISQMQHYVALYRAGDSTIRERREMLEAHLDSVLAQIDMLEETRTLLERKIHAYLQQEGHSP